jgi:hypothetical protein
VDKTTEKILHDLFQKELSGLKNEVNELKKSVEMFKNEILEKLETIQDKQIPVENHNSVQSRGNLLLNRMCMVENMIEGKKTVPFNKEDLEGFPHWEQVLSKIQASISKPSFETWFNGTFAKQIEHNSIVIFSKNEFQSEWLAERYRLLILSILTELTGNDFDIQFVCE